MSSIYDEIKRLKAEINTKQTEIDKISKLIELYPDLERYTSRGSKVRYCSKSINSIATNSTITHSCSCCSDPSLVVLPYIKTPYGIVYSNPDSFHIGEKDYSYGDRPNKDWDTKLREASISEAIIEQIKQYFRKQKKELQQMIEDNYNDVE